MDETRRQELLSQTALGRFVLAQEQPAAFADYNPDEPREHGEWAKTVESGPVEKPTNLEPTPNRASQESPGAPTGHGSAPAASSPVEKPADSEPTPSVQSTQTGPVERPDHITPHRWSKMDAWSRRAAIAWQRGDYDESTRLHKEAAESYQVQAKEAEKNGDHKLAGRLEYKRVKHLHGIRNDIDDLQYLNRKASRRTSQNLTDGITGSDASAWDRQLGIAFPQHNPW